MVQVTAITRLFLVEFDNDPNGIFDLEMKNEDLLLENFSLWFLSVHELYTYLNLVSKYPIEILHFEYFSSWNFPFRSGLVTN